MLNPRQLQQKSQSVAQRRQHNQRIQQCQQANRRKSPAVVVPPTQSAPVQTATQPLSNAQATNPRNQRKRQESTPKKAQAQPTSPTISPTTPAISKRRSKKADLSRSVEEGGLPEWDSPPKSVSNKRSKRASPPKDDSPISWQQAAFVNSAPLPALDISSLVGKPTATGSFSTPTSPVRASALTAQPAIIRSPTMPSLDVKVKRPTTHTRTPSYPTFPMHRERDTFNINGGSPALEALFNLSINESSNPLFTRPKPASYGSAPGIHARMAKNNTKKTGPIFASASFQHAPEAMTLPKPFFRLGASRETSDASSDDGVVDLAEESSGEDESSDSSYTPAFLL
ncbi:hypothetical protein FRC03_011773 [Tulasnella sp. 419]|nr:hypothetical protein FRC03_011773 [Tulasnella sp. 419]